MPPRFQRGASDVLTLLFEANSGGDERFMIRSRVEAPLPGSLLPADELDWDVGLPPSVPRSGWKRGFLYTSVTELSNRPGRERFVGWWASSTSLVTTKAGAREVTLLVVP